MNFMMNRAKFGLEGDILSLFREDEAGWTKVAQNIDNCGWTLAWTGRSYTKKEVTDGSGFKSIRESRIVSENEASMILFEQGGD